MENTLRQPTETKAQQIIKAEPCGINRTMYLDKVFKYPEPVMPGEAHTHEALRRELNLTPTQVLNYKVL